MLKQSVVLCHMVSFVYVYFQVAEVYVCNFAAKPVFSTVEICQNAAKYQVNCLSK